MESGTGMSMSDFESLMATSDVELLKKAWRDEKSAPEILPFHSPLIQRSYEQIQLMIEKDMIHISKTDLWDRLSEQEQRFAKRCYDSMKNYMDESVLSKLPVGYQSNLKQSNASEEDDMVPEPSLDTFVFCKSEGSIGSIPLDDSGDEIVDLVAGDLYVLRYKSIKPYLENGKIDLV
ncbi:hypothetical protein KSS87_020110 [Heliosperma pusillum]|nr:hypothetical protein KSS87_020110 [Heliosperma pusillum]